VSDWHPATVPWRTGQSVGRTIYACPPGSSHRDGEVLIGIMDTPELAKAAVDAHNVLIRGRSYSCDCGRVHATMPIGRQPCCGDA
jgi:hypothetical protein